MVSNPQFSPHGNLDYSRVRYTNIGTGAKANEVEPRKRDWLANLIPGFIRQGVFLKQTLTEIAVNSEDKVEHMRLCQSLNSNKIMYERFDANHGVSNIRLDDYKALRDIRKNTELYLDEQDTKDLLEDVGLAIATDYLNSQPTHRQDMQRADLTVNKSQSQQPLKAPSIMLTSSSISSAPSSHSNYPESDTHVLFPNHDNLQSAGPAPRAEHPAEIHFPPDGDEHSKDYGNEDSGIDIIEPETPMAAAPT